MGFTKREEQVLMPLVADCVNFGLSEKEALNYIKIRLGREIAKDAYYRRKKKVDAGKYATEWLNYFTRVGYLITHKQILDVIDMVQKDTIRDYLIENNRMQKDPELIHSLRNEIRENAKLMQEVSLGTPIIAQIKAKLENAQMLSTSK